MLKVEDFIYIVEIRERLNTLMEFEIVCNCDIDDARVFLAKQGYDLSKINNSELIDFIDEIINVESKKIEERVKMYDYLDSRSKFYAELSSEYMINSTDICRFYDYLINDFVEDFCKWHPQEIYCSCQAYDKESKKFIDVDCSPRVFAEDILKDAISEFDILMSNGEVYSGYDIDVDVFEDDTLRGMARDFYQPIIDVAKKHNTYVHIDDEMYYDCIGKRMEH